MLKIKPFLKLLAHWKADS